MSSKLVKKLKRDLQKSPGKAAALGGLLLLATWFWAPLVKGWLGGGTATSATGSTAIEENNSQPASPVNVAEQSKYTWKQLADAIAHDVRMQPVSSNESTRNPFERHKRKEAIPLTIEETKPAPVLDFPPAAVGLVLTGTITGGQQRAARLNGKTYRIGDTIEVAAETSTIKYVLVEVRGRSVTMSRNGKKYELKMAHSPVNATTSTAVSVSSDDPDFDPALLEGGQ